MRLNLTRAIVGGALLGLAAFVWLKASRTRDRIEQEILALNATRQIAEADASRARERLAAASIREGELTRTLEGLHRAKSPTATTAKPPAPAPRTMTDIIASHPDVEVLMLRWQREVSGLEYGPFFRAHGLTAEQVRRFQDNWVKRTEQGIDLRAASKLETAPDPTTTAVLQQQSESAYEATQAELLGPAAYAELQEFQRTLPLRNIVVLGLAGASALEGIPLTTQQGEQLFQAALKSMDPDRAAGTSGEKLLTHLDWDALDRQAQQILTPAQFALFTGQATPSGFNSRWKYQLDAALRRAREADAANVVSTRPPP